jgi:hypothetical protein
MTTYIGGRKPTEFKQVLSRLRAKPPLIVNPHNNTAYEPAALGAVHLCRCQQEPAVRAANRFHLSLYGFGDEDGDMARTGNGSRRLWYDFCGILTAWLFKRFYRKVMASESSGLMTTLLNTKRILASEELRLEYSLPRRMKAKQSNLPHVWCPYLAQHPGHDSQDCHSLRIERANFVEEVNNALNRDWTELVSQTGVEYIRNHA